MIGAETTDAPDQGRWYALLPALLDAGTQVATTLVGDALDAGFDSSAARFAPKRSARCVRASLADFWDAENIAAFDIAAVFHPGMQKNRGWLNDGSLARIIAAGVRRAERGRPG